MIRTLSRLAVSGVALVGLAACHDNLLIPQYNAPTVSGVNADPNGLQLYVSGILLALRGSNERSIRDLGNLGRESYWYFPTDGRSVSGYLTGLTGPNNTRLLDPTGFASGNWFPHYTNMRNTVNTIGLASGSKTLSSQQKSAVYGFARTIHALEQWYVAISRDSLGAPIVIPADPSKPAPFVSRDAEFAYISALLDSAQTDLQAAGTTAFPFVLTDGFAGFDSPATFLQFNRALAARVLVNRGSLGCSACYAQALTALGGSFIMTPTSISDLNIGVYSVYSTTAGDALNSLNINVDNNFFAHASALTDAQLKPDSTPDARATRKVAPLAVPRPAPGGLKNGIPATAYFILYPTTTSPVGIIRNEELVLLRAEAEIQTGNAAAGLADLNSVRTVSGGLAPLTSLGADPITTLLYERRYSLLDEGHRWNDVRRFGRLSTLPLDLPFQFVARVQPIPTQECNARTGALLPPTGC